MGLKAFVFIVLALLFLVAGQHWSIWSKVESAAATLVSPIQYGVSLPVRFAGWLGSNVTSHQDLMAENAKLRAQLLLLQGKVQKLTSLEHENADLRGLMSAYRVKQKAKKFLVAHLLNVSAGNVDQQIVLNQGSSSGVYVNQPALDAYGVMGQVILVSGNTSRVMLLNDAKSAIPVQVSRNGERSIAIGLGYTNNLQLINVAETMDIKPGDLLVTSGLGGVFPEGYPVGVVASIDHVVGAKFSRVIVKPNAHFNQSRQVLLIWPKKNN